MSSVVTSNIPEKKFNSWVPKNFLFSSALTGEDKNKKTTIM